MNIILKNSVNPIFWIGMILIFNVSCSKKNDLITRITDQDGNVYNTVTIGTQVWMAENLKVTKYNDGTPIPLVTDNGDWAYLTTPGYCWYNDSISYKNNYGAMYNWYTVNSGKLCPIGWHIPSQVEWTILTDFLGGLTIAGGKLKESGNLHWNLPNTDATNISKFTGLPGGYRNYNGGAFLSLNLGGTWWSSTPDISSSSWSIAVVYDSSQALLISNNNNYGISVRCIKD